MAMEGRFPRVERHEADGFEKLRVLAERFDDEDMKLMPMALIKFYQTYITLLKTKRPEIN
jgi:hypothetical protein